MSFSLSFSVVYLENHLLMLQIFFIIFIPSTLLICSLYYFIVSALLKFNLFFYIPKCRVSVGVLYHHFFPGELSGRLPLTQTTMKYRRNKNKQTTYPCKHCLSKLKLPFTNTYLLFIFQSPDLSSVFVERF